MSDVKTSVKDQSNGSAIELLQLSQPARVLQRYTEPGNGSSSEEDSVEVASGTLSVQLVTLALSDAYGPPSPTSASALAASGQSIEETDIFLVLSIPSSNFSLPLMATQVILPHRTTNSYSMRSDELPGASIVLTLSPQTPREEVHLFEDTIASYCAFEDDSRPQENGTIEVLSAEDGSVLGTLDLAESGIVLKEDASASKHAGGNEKEPVLIELDLSNAGGDEKRVTLVRTISSLSDGDKTASAGSSGTQQQQKDWLLRGADYLSRNIASGSIKLGSAMQASADRYVAKQASTPTSEKETKIHPGHLQRAEAVHRYSGKAVQVSNKTAQSIQHVAGRFGERLGKATGIASTSRSTPAVGSGEQGSQAAPPVPPKGFRGAINRSLVAVSTVWDSVDTSAQRLIEDGSTAATRMIRSRYGDDAATLSAHIGGTTKSAVLVYRDVSGVRRRALLKVAGAGMLKGKTGDGREVQIQLRKDTDVDEKRVA